MPVRWKITSTDPGLAGAALDWRWQLRNAVRDLDELARVLSIDAEQLESYRRATACGMPLNVTPYFLGLCSPSDARCPIRMQCVPSGRECRVVEGELADPLGEQAHQVAPYLIRRYPDRALLLVTMRCATHCRFCTRARLVRTKAGPCSQRALTPAMQWLRQHAEVREILLSGGDPLTLSTARLAALVRRVREIPSIELVRIATRTPAVLPMRIDAELVEALRSMQPIWFMVHFNHPKELTAQARRAVELLVDGGFPVMSQTVILKGVNDEASVLMELFRTLVNQRVRPYYLLHGDVIAGSWHLRTTVERSIALYGELQGKLSGLAVPKLVIDTPGGKGKVVVGPESIVGRAGRVTTLRTFRGELVDIVDPPVE